ncbi:MAG: class I SAM-dependent methyltransferase [Methylotenera sp.]
MEAVWQSEAGNPPPKNVVIADDTTNAKVAYKLICEGTGFLYKGDFQNAKQLLQAITRKVDSKPIAPAENLTQAFHQHRARQIQRANITNKILIELNHGACDLKRAPEVKDAVTGAIITNAKLDKVPAKLVLSLRELLGMIGAYEWRKKGVFIDALQANIHAHYGVYSPIRGEYLELINNTPLNNVKTAFDIGTGTGVIAAILVTRGVKAVMATDNNIRALLCASENIKQLGLTQYITVEQADLFPKDKKADLIVCNPPWLPAKANAPIEHAIYDPNSQMLKGFLNGVKAHLNEGGEAWLILSDLAEHLGLRTKDELHKWIADAGLSVVEKRDIAPKHAKASDQSDPLYLARSKEITSLYRLK